MNPLVVTGIMFACMILLMLTGLPLTFVMGALGVGFCLALWGLAGLNTLYYAVFGIMDSFILSAIPLFLFMGLVLQKSGIADDLFDTVYRWTGGLRGGLGMGVIVICAIFAAMVGVTGAATVSMGIIALPAMLNRKYDKRIATGLIQAGGALGILIPPSIPMIMYAYISGVSVGKLFAGGIFPGIMLATMHIIYIGVRCYLQPEMAPALPPEERATWKAKVVSLKYVLLPIILIFVVLGFIFFGIASPTEASAVGAFGALICAAVRGRLNWQLVKETGFRSLRITGMVFWIIFAAVAFSKIYTGLGAPAMIQEIMVNLAIGPWGILIIVQVIFFILGMFLSDGAILFICMPIFLPIALSQGFDTTWFGVLYVLNMEMAYLTPPFGYNLFYMKGIVPPEITLADIYRSVAPFVALQAAALGIAMIFPRLVTFLPDLLF